MEPYDYIIVGAGSAGCVLAGRLSEDPATRVLLLEAGGRDDRLEIRMPAAFSKLFKGPCDWSYTTAPQSSLGGRELYWPRGKVLGGCSSINGQVYVRGHRADFDGWDTLGNTGWSYEDVLPYFRRSEAFSGGTSPFHGASGPLSVTAGLREPNPATIAFLRAAQEAGIPLAEDVNGEAPEGASLCPVTQKNGRRWSAVDAFLRPARRRRNLAVRTGAHATRVLFEGRRAVGVEYLCQGAPLRALAAREVILSGGAVSSPQLLMLSGVGPADHLRRHGIAVVHDLPGVGLNLQDHPGVGVVVSCTRPVTLVAAESLGNLLRFFVSRKGMLTSNVAEACAFVRTRAGLPAPDLELVFGPAPFVDHGLVKVTRHGLTIGVVALQPSSRGSLSLRSADPLAPPFIQPNYLSDPDGDDLRVLVDGVELAQRIFRAPALAPLVGEPMGPGPEVGSSRADLERFVRAQAQTAYHPVGTCAMGVDDPSVVDPRLRVRGVDALRVVDASVMPRIPRGHTNAPTIMIAEKAVDLIRADAQLGEARAPRRERVDHLASHLRAPHHGPARHPPR